jgi:hypothetical protein
MSFTPLQITILNFALSTFYFVSRKMAQEKAQKKDQEKAQRIAR